jgi:hypothetical protein
MLEFCKHDIYCEQLSSSSTYLKEIELPEAFIRLRADRIIHVHYKRDATLDVPLQMQMRKIYFDLTGGAPSRFLFTAEEGFSITPEARKNAPRTLKESPIESYALVVNNLGYRLIVNFYFKVMKPNGNYKLFENVEEALLWLHSLKKNKKPRT